ncbi:alpha/beta hydrolase family esterase [Nocardia goodfellowii]
MASSLTTRISALLGAACAALVLAVTATGPAAAEEEFFDEPDGVAAACSTASTNGTKLVDNFDTADPQRHYLVNVPAGIPAGGAPLVVMIHGGRESPAGIEQNSGWTGFANQKKAIVVYPRGSKWEPKMDNSPGWGWNADQDDVEHIKKVVANVRAKWCVDPRRIHLSGHSNGGQMASRLGCAESLFFASGAVYAPAPPPTGCDPARPISWGVFHSAGDTTVFEPVAYGHLMYWNWENRPCGNEQNDGGTDVKDSNRWSCDAGTQTLWRVYNGGTHWWPTGARRTEMMNRMWQLFQAYPRP